MLRSSDFILTTLGALKGPKKGNDTVRCVYKGYSGVRVEHTLGEGGAKGKGGKKMPLALIQMRDGFGGLLSQGVPPPHLRSPGFPLFQRSQYFYDLCTPHYSLVQCLRGPATKCLSHVVGVQCVNLL